MNTVSPDRIEKIHPIKDAGTRLRHALIYIAIFILFTRLFSGIVSYYMHDSDRFSGPVDTRAWECKCFDQQYVQDIKQYQVYKIPEYLRSFVPMDLVFPVLYTLMFFTVLNVRGNKELYTKKFKIFYDIFYWLVIVGMILDYLENLSFFLHLNTQADLSFIVAIMTTIKTIFFSINIGGFLVAFVRTTMIYFKNSRTQY